LRATLRSFRHFVLVMLPVLSKRSMSQQNQTVLKEKGGATPRRWTLSKTKKRVVVAGLEMLTIVGNYYYHVIQVYDVP
jgi:hypothetical protein